MVTDPTKYASFERPTQFYDRLAASYHLIFENWSAYIDQQANTLGPIIEEACGSTRLRVLDCACGIGTQVIGLARRGHIVTASDISPAAVERARTEAASRKLDIVFSVADMRQLSTVHGSEFDAVLVADNAIPHLMSDEDLLQSAQSAFDKLRDGGLFVATIRDYDQLAIERPTGTTPSFYSDSGRDRIVHQVWHWIGSHVYRWHLYITYETATGWVSQHYVSIYRALIRSELTDILHKTGFKGIKWLMPLESGYHQPIIVARR